MPVLSDHFAMSFVAFLVLPMSRHGESHFQRKPFLFPNSGIGSPTPRPLRSACPERNSVGDPGRRARRLFMPGTAHRPV